MTDSLIFVSDDDFEKLVDLLYERRRMVNRHALAKKKPSRQQYTLAEKLAIDRKHKAELDELNQQIDELMKRTGGAD
jgi:hypothetical protein